MQKTKIEYLTHSWSPIAMRCTPVSTGCANCWHLAMAKRLAKNPVIDRNRQTAYAGGPFLLDEKELEAPLHLKKPARIGVQFMGDLFHDNISMEWIGRILRLARAITQHKFFFLTKRPKRMRDALWPWDIKGDVIEPKPDHLFFGISVEDQRTADERIPILLQIPAGHRWVSIEPMLGPVDLEPYLNWERLGEKFNSLNWVVLGGETGPKARPLHPDWVRSLRDQCRAAGVPFFFKQLSGKQLIPKDLMIREFPK